MNRRLVIAVCVIVCGALVVSVGGNMAGPPSREGVIPVSRLAPSAGTRTFDLADAGLRTAGLAANIMTEGFESTWPAASWQTLDNSAIDGGDFRPGKRTCHPRSGANALWLTGGGTSGTALACGAQYPNSAITWAIYGPFSLVGATSAKLSFYLYGKSEANDTCSWDYFFVGSAVTSTYSGPYVYCGDWTNGPEGSGYSKITLDLAARLGQSQVKVAFLFASDNSNTDIGFHVDDVALDVTTQAPPTSSPTPTTTRRPGERSVNLPLTVKSLQEPGAIIRDSRGQIASALNRSDAVYTDFTGLKPRTQYDVQVLGPTGSELTLSRFTTDGNGNIPTSALAYDLGQTMTTYGLSSPAPSAVGRHTVLVRTLAGVEVRRWTFDLREPTGPIVYASNSAGVAINSFLWGAHYVYARGEGFRPGSTVPLYVVTDRWNWVLGTALGDVTGAAEIATVGGDGKFLVRVWPLPSPVGGYDIVADIDWDGNYTAADTVDGYWPVGFMVQQPNTGVAIQVQLACDAQYNYKDLFLTSENVYIAVNPLTQMFQHAFGHKYVVIHRDAWVQGDALVDVTEGPERDHPQYGCTNEGRVLIWPATLAPGVYDVIFDINHNGVYDVGVDLLDNIDSFGNAVGGFFVPGAPGSPVVTITSPANGSSTADGVITLRGTVTSPTTITWAKWYVNAGDKSSSGDLTITSGAFNQRIYLFPGQNNVQVWVRNAAGTGTAAIVVTSAISGIWDIQASLTWPEAERGRDVDLHLVRPGSVRDNHPGDCHYNNMTPDWGLAGATDDNPTLNIDYTTQGTGPEIITFHARGRVEANGRYTLGVHYFSDHGLGQAHPVIRLWVRGQLYNFGPVTMSNGQWWTVCYIDLPTGLVTPVNTVN